MKQTPFNTAGAPRHLCISFAGQRIRVESSSPYLMRVLAAHLQHCILADKNCEHAAPFEVASASLPDDQVLTDSLNEIITRLIAPCSEALILHAAGVTLQKRGIVLCGSSGSGKSTLTAWLLRQQFGYLSDEVIAISADGTPLMTGFARSLVLKAGASLIWRSLIAETERVQVFKDGGAWIPPEVLNQNGVVSSSTVQLILFPRYDSEAKFAVEPLSPAQTTFRLMQHIVNARNLPQHGLSGLAALARATRAYALTYANAAHVSDWLFSNP